MVSKQMEELGRVRSVIREIFEYGIIRAAEVGPENVFDFSIGNPSVPAPESVRETILDIVGNTDPVAIHAYTSAPGDIGVRKVIADQLNRDYKAGATASDIFMTCGAAPGLAAVFKALTYPGDEFVAIAPYFPEYKVFVAMAEAGFKVVPPETESFQIDFDKLEEAINYRTKGLIINSPNNPTGTIYSEKTIIKLSALLTIKAKQYGHPIYLISDEPYRALVYDDSKLPFVPNYYQDTLFLYSYSKALSLPGERIGYIYVPSKATGADSLLAAIAGAVRSLGYVCAPSLFQRVIERCNDDTADLSVYARNKEILYKGLVDAGYSVVKPEGAFYIFPKSLEPDAKAFCERAKKYDLLMVPGDGFGCPGHVRISYCVPTEKIERALPLFKKLAEDYGVHKKNVVEKTVDKVLHHDKK